jgi:phage shock protein E
VDVRTPQEYSAGHIPTAVNIPVSTIAKQFPTEDKDALIIVYCASGMRSATAKRTLDAAGFTNVVNFGPVSRWEGQLATGDAPGD